MGRNVMDTDIFVIGEFRQCLEIIIEADDHKTCLDISKVFKKQCDAWAFNVYVKEYKSAPKSAVLKRDLMIYQTAYPGDILIFKEAMRRIFQHSFILIQTSK